MECTALEINLLPTDVYVTPNDGDLQFEVEFLEGPTLRFLLSEAFDGYLDAWRDGTVVQLFALDDLQEVILERRALALALRAMAKRLEDVAAADEVKSNK